MKNEKVHSILLALVGGYLYYLAYQLFEKYRTETKEMPDFAFVLFIIVFAVAGTGVLLWSWMIYRKQRNQEGSVTEEPTEQEKHEDPDTLK